MSEIIQLLNSFGYAITTIIEFIYSSLVSVFALMFNIPNYLTFITDSLRILPSFLLPFMMAYISIIVIQYIANRKGS